MAMTPSDSPSSPSNYAMVTPHGRGPAPYDLQAPMSDGEISAAYDAANAVEGPRQSATQTLLESPQGFASGGYDIDSGSAFGWPTDVEPVHDGP